MCAIGRVSEGKREGGGERERGVFLEIRKEGRKEEEKGGGGECGLGDINL